MCGIAGCITNNALINKQKFKNALEYLDHRGPDDTGIEEIKLDDGLLILGHKRLSILDLSGLGHQPMISSSKNLILTFNGEIYNYKELKKELSCLGFKFETSSDTEVLLNAWTKWGKDCINKFRGMFAFGIYDKTKQVLTLVRDNFGIKPLYYKKDKSNLYFSSEINAILKLSPYSNQPNYVSFYNYLVQNTYDNNSDTFFENIYQLEPGYLIEFQFGDEISFTKAKWWQPNFKKFQKPNYENSVFELRNLFLKNIELHLRSDVPVGAALSGGLDSSSIVCAMRYLYPDMDINTFTYIDDNQKISEFKWAKIVNEYVGAIPHYVRGTSENLKNDLDNLIKSQGEPFASTSSYAQYCVYKAAKDNGIKVTLDGQGADELLGGYDGYVGYRMLSLIEEFKIFKTISFLIKWSKYPRRNIKLGIMDLGRITLPDKIYMLLRKKLNRDFRPNWLNYDFLKKYNIYYSEIRDDFKNEFSGKRVTEKLIASLNGRGLPALLRIADRNSMQFSVESRLPFLTCDMAEFTLNLPENFFIDENGLSKSIFRKAMKGIVPENILWRKDKIGLETSQNKWILKNSVFFREILESWALKCDAVDEERLMKYFDFSIEKYHNSDAIWRLINYAYWYENFIG